jgi:hypothetical protein
MNRQRLYVTAFVQIKGNERRTYRVFAYNKTDAAVAGVKAIEQEFGEKWRETWWQHSTERE